MELAVMARVKKRNGTQDPVFQDEFEFCARREKKDRKTPPGAGQPPSSSSFLPFAFS